VTKPREVILHKSAPIVQGVRQGFTSPTAAAEAGPAAAETAKSLSNSRIAFAGMSPAAASVLWECHASSSPGDSVSKAGVSGGSISGCPPGMPGKQDHNGAAILSFTHAGILF